MLMDTPTDTNAKDAIGNAANARAARAARAGVRRCDFLSMMTSLRSLPERRLNAAEITSISKEIYATSVQRQLNGVADYGLLLDERSLDYVVTRLADVRRDLEAAGIEHCARVRKHPRTAADHDSILLRVQRRKVEVFRQLARLNERCQASIVGMGFTSDCRIIMQFLAHQIAKELVPAQLLDQMFHDCALTNPANTVNENDVLESIVNFRVLDDAHERRGARARAQQIEPLARLQIVKHKRTCGLTADQNRVALANVLQTGRKRTVRNLNAQKLEVFLVVCTGDAVGAQERPVIDVEPHHHELPVLKSQPRVPRRGESELSVRPMLYCEYAFRSYRSQDKVTCRKSIGQNVTGAASFCGFSGT